MKKQHNFHWLTLLVIIIFSLLVWFALFGCSKHERETMTAQFACISDAECAVWYGVYESDMRQAEAWKCWGDTMAVGHGETIMLNAQTFEAPATLLLAIYLGEDCISLSQAGVEAHSSGEVLIITATNN